MKRHVLLAAAVAFVAVVVIGAVGTGVGAAETDAADEKALEAYVVGDVGYLYTNANADSVTPSEFTQCEAFEPTDEEMADWEENQPYAPQPKCIVLTADELNDGEWSGDLTFPTKIIEKDHDVLGDVYAETDIETVDGASGTYDEATGEFTLSTTVDIGLAIYNVDEHGDEYSDSDRITDETCHIPSVEFTASSEKSIDRTGLEGERIQDGTGTFVANDFAIDEAEQCGSYLGTDLNAAVSEEQGLPANAGDAEVAFDMNLDEPQPTGTLEGTVTSQGSGDLGVGEGTPLEGATVAMGGSTTTTDEDGFYSMSVPAGSDTAEVTAPGHAAATATVTVSEDSVTTQDFGLEASADYVVRAPDVEGERDESVDVPVTFEPIYDDVDDVGNFELVFEYDTDALSLDGVSEGAFDLGDETYTQDGSTLTVSYGSASNPFDETHPPDSTAFVAHFTIDAEHGTESAVAFDESASVVNDRFLFGGDDAVYVDGSVTAVRGEGTIDGTVVDENGEPIEAATVAIDEGPGERVETTTDGSGTFSATVVEGEYTVAATADGYESNATNVAVASDETVDPVLELAAVDDGSSGSSPVGGGGDRVVDPEDILGEDPDATDGDGTNGEDAADGNEEGVGSGGEEGEDPDDGSPSDGPPADSDDDESGAGADTGAFSSSLANAGLLIALIAVAGAVIVGVGTIMGPSLLPPTSKE